MARHCLVKSDGLEIQINHSGECGEIEAVTDSIVALIDGVNLDEAEDAVRIRFYGSILKALAINYAVGQPNAEECTYLELIEGIEAEVGIPVGLGCKYELEGS